MQQKLEAFLDTYEAQLLELKQKLHSEKMPALTEELFAEFERTGNRLKYEDAYFGRRKFLSVYGLLAVCYEQHRTAENLRRLEEIIENICEEECWALPAHVNRTEDVNWRITLDLFATETVFSLADIVGRLRGALAEETYERVKAEVYRRVLQPFISSEAGVFWWEQTSMNWCAVCCGSVGGAAIWLMEEGEQKTQLLARIQADIAHYLEGFSADGACLEGLGYFTYGMSFYEAFVDLLYTHSNGRIELLADEKVRRIARVQGLCFLPGGVSLRFSDCMEKEQFRVGLTAYFAMHYDDIVFPEFEMAADFYTDNCFRYVVLSRDILWAKQYQKWLKERNKNDIFPRKEQGILFLPQAQWAIHWSKNACVLTAKGGHNDEPHNHNDVGSFCYAAQGRMILDDLGAGEYTRDYFGEHRYEKLCCRSLGHNVPLIDGMEQKAGREYRAESFAKDADGRIRLEMGRAYDLDEAEMLYRSFTFCQETGECTIIDEFVLQKGRRITENLISRYEPKTWEHGFVIQLDSEHWIIECQGGEAYAVEKETYIDHYGSVKNAWRMQWNVMGASCKISIYKESDARYIGVT